MAFALFCAIAANADIRFKNIFQNNMLLQANEENLIAGKADAPAQEVTLTVKAVSKDGKVVEKTLKTKSDKNKRWMVKIPAFPKRTNIELTASADGKSVKIGNIITGELWLTSGQSNMEWHFGNASVDASFREKYMQDADSLNGDIRMIKANNTILPEQIDEIMGDWRVIDGRHIRHSSTTQVGYIFASIISKALDTPVGIVNASWGGSRIEPWISKDAFLNSETCRPIYERQMAGVEDYVKLRENYLKNYPKWLEENPTGHLQNKNRDTRPRLPSDVVSDNRVPSCMYNAMIHGVAPLSPKGVLWYQGESNANEPYEYGELKKLLVSSWRKHFRRNFHFYYIELAAFTNTQNNPVQYGSWGAIREAQAEVLDLPNTGVVTSVDDGGSVISGQGDIHPPHKELISKRLAKLALAQVYKKGKASHAISPAYKSMKIDGNKIIIELTNAEGLQIMHQPKINSSKEVPLNIPEKITGFAIRGENPRDWKYADVEIKNGKLIVSSPEVASPKAVRYAWGSWPLACLKNKYDLPLRPFSTDNGMYVDYNRQKPVK